MARNKDKTEHAQQEVDPSETNGANSTAAATLAGASDQSLQKFLGRRQQAKANNKNFKKPSKLGASAAGILPRLQNLSNEAALCGAPAGNLCEEEESEKAKPSGRSRVEDETIIPPSWQPADMQLEEEDDEEEEDEEDWELADAYDAFDVPPQVDANLVISLADGKKQEEASKQRRRYTKEEIFAAALVHQCHALCLIGRGHMLDLAASDPVVQAATYSLLPEAVLKTLQVEVSKLQASSLTEVVQWFQKEVKPSDVPQTFSAEEEAQLKEEGGTSASVCRLQTVSSVKSGSTEELVAVFVALLRAAGLLVRFVRALDPLPWRPSLSELMVPQHRKQQRRSRAVRKNPPKEGKSGRAKNAKGKGKAAKADVGGKEEYIPNGTSRKRSRAQEAEIDQDLDQNIAAGVKKEEEEEEPEATGKRAVKGRGGGSSKKGGRQRKKQAKGSEAVKLEEEELRSKTAIKEEDEEIEAEVPSKKPRKAKGDIEFENQLAMAMLSSVTSTSLAEQDAPNPEQKAEEALRLRQGLHGRKLARGVAVSSLQQAAAGNYPDQMADSWAEVYCGGEDEGRGRWVHIHPLYGWINKPENVEGGSIRFGQLAYVVAFSGGGAKDITSRYVADFRLASKARGPCKQWWEETLRPLRSAEMEATNSYMASWTAAEAQKASPIDSKPLATASPQKVQNLRKPAGYKAKEAKARVAREDQELQSRIHKQQTEVPSTLEAFKQHKVFVLQRHISRYDALRPGAVKSGLHKGEAFYKREDISELHTKDKWVQQGLEVKEEELRNPFKVVAKRGSKKNQAASKDAGDEEEAPDKKAVAALPADETQQTWLYGRWQCQAWLPPKAEGGVVPKNERGSVHCPPLAACIPEGTRQINRPRIVGICKRLEVDYGMAMTGFDIRGGRSIPRFEGIVVCEEFADQVLQEWEEEQERIAERTAQKRLQEARTTWASLLKAMFTRLGLQTAEAARKQPSKKKTKPAAKSKAEDSCLRNDEAAQQEDESSPEQKRQKQKGKRKATGKSQTKDQVPAEKEVAGGKRKRGKAVDSQKEEALSFQRPEVEEI